MRSRQLFGSARQYLFYTLKDQTMRPLLIYLAILLSIPLIEFNRAAIAQVISDGTLSTTVTQSGNNFTITNGNQVGSNLFHSFGQFSVPTGGSAYFNNALDIQTIFARVTGGNVSNIDGLIRANGSANLFLLNPSGILFGPNAQLNIGGSFVASTANSVVFADGVEFSAANPQASPLLTISVPIGLQMSSNPALIAVRGTGHVITSGGSILAPLIENPSPTELRVQPGKTLALVGGNLALTGATLSAPAGQVELGSLSGAGLVNLIPIAQGYQLSYENGQQFGDIQITQQSLLTVGALPSSGFLNAGSVRLQGRQIRFSDGSLVLSNNLGNLPGGEIFLQASEAIEITGTTANALISTGIRTAAFNSGASSNVRINVPRLTLAQGAAISTTATGSARSGDIQINAEVVEVTGFSPLNPIGVTSLGTSSASTQPAGNLFVTSKNLLVSGGASISSTTFGAGSTGQVVIRATDTVVTGENLAGLYSNISATTFSTGSAQTVTLDTTRLQLLNGGVVATTAWLIGDAGNVSVNATESILISGRSQINNSGINSAVIRPEPLLQQAFGLPDVLTANSGSVIINTPNLVLTDGGAVSVTNQGSGDGGSIRVTANRILLNRQGSIQAQTASGEGGNISVQVGSLLLLRRNSLMSATSGGAGNGGNIAINSPMILGLENSDIIANAFRGRGGNIEIITQALLGLQFRSQLTSESDITVSSQFGVSGMVQVNTIGVDPNSGLAKLPENIMDSSQQIATGCKENQSSSFVATGRGGLPQNPTQQVLGDRPWNDTRDLSTYRQAGHSGVVQMPVAPKVLVEATAWQQQPDGTVELTAAPSAATALPAFATCSRLTQTTLTQ